MNDLKKLGRNIRALRETYGETQEELGAILHYEKNTISSYETGRTEPKKDTLAEIAKHYMISVEELMYCDFSDTGSITIDNYAFWKNISILLPIISSDEAMQDIHFRRAYQYHKNYYNMLQKIELNGFSDIDFDQVGDCADEYYKALENETIRPETAANLLALFKLLMVYVSVGPSALQNQSAALIQAASKDLRIKECIDNLDSEFSKEAKEFANEFNDPEIKGELHEWMMIIKQSKWADLAYYYMALNYIWNYTDNDLGWDFNRRIGAEMLASFASVGNVYATRYLKWSVKAMGLSSQTVDDR